MDPLGVTASAIAVVTLAWQSCKAANDLIDGIVEAPRAIARSKASLSETRSTLSALQKMLTRSSEPAGVLDSVLRAIELGETLKSTQRLCDEFAAIISSMANHSTDARFSKRDRVAVVFNEAKIKRLNEQLADCQRTIAMALGSMNLIVSAQSAADIKRLGDQFNAQEQALATLNTQLRNLEILPAGSDSSASEDNTALQLTAELQKLCLQALAATRAKRTGQSFGSMSTYQHSQAMQGIVGKPHDGVEQVFGKMNTSNNSRAFQGQIDAASFAMMFGKTQ